MEELPSSEMVFKLLEDVALLMNGDRDEGLDVLNELIEKLSVIAYEFKTKNKPSTIREAYFLLRDIMELYKKAIHFVCKEDQAKIDPLKYVPSIPTEIDLIKRPPNMMPEMLLSYMAHATEFVVGHNRSVSQCNTLIDLGIITLMNVVNQTLNTYYSTPNAVSDIHRMSIRLQKKSSTAKARGTKQAESRTTHDNIIKIYEGMKEKYPKISKNAASLLIGEIGKINLTPQVIRKHLTS